MLVNNEWRALTKLDINEATAYNAYPSQDHRTIEECLKFAWLNNFSKNGMDEQLVNAEGRIVPNGVVRGWAFFEYPPDITKLTGMERLRVTLTDIVGNTEQHVHDRSEELNPNRVLTQYLEKLPGGPFDISGLPRSRWPLGQLRIVPK